MSAMGAFQDGVCDLCDTNVLFSIRKQHICVCAHGVHACHPRGFQSRHMTDTTHFFTVTLRAHATRRGHGAGSAHGLWMALHATCSLLEAR